MTADDITVKLEPLCRYLEEELRKELTAQGHIATGNLLASIKVEVQKTVTGNEISGYGNKYARYVDTGRKPGGRRVPIDALIAWVQVKGLASGKKAISLAWAIQASIFKNGVPTNRDVSKTMFVTRTLKNTKTKVSGDIKEIVYAFYTAELTNIIRNVKESLNAS
jgi:hypothetical protein